MTPAKRTGAETVDDQRVNLLALCAVPGMSWSLVAREALRPGGVHELREGRPRERSDDAADAVASIAKAAAEFPKHVDRVRAELASAANAGARLTTVLDDDYPPNLRVIYNLPPFLFYRGVLEPDDARAVAVVGTRSASADGLRRARAVTRGLARDGVTVLSGLAKGIDAAAHRATLESGSRTIAVLGTGILRCYPKEHEALAEEIAQKGALVSQFWPSAPPTRTSFPMRNVVMSGLGQGTVVVEASVTSGAKMQARLALLHGKKVFLMRSLVAEQSWARSYVDRGAIEIASVADVVRDLRTRKAVELLSEQRQQLLFDAL